jgi:hypothetical protein
MRGVVGGLSILSILVVTVIVMSGQLIAGQNATEQARPARHATANPLAQQGAMAKVQAVAPVVDRDAQMKAARMEWLSAGGQLDWPALIAAIRNDEPGSKITLGRAETGATVLVPAGAGKAAFCFAQGDGFTCTAENLQTGQTANGAAGTLKAAANAASRLLP